MCERLEQEYRIWLEELLEILWVVCEDVVPAGRVDEKVYWQTKALYKECKSIIQTETYAELLQYALEGRKLLEPVEEALETVKKENILEETIVRLRRKHASAILTSLQMLVNFACFAEEYLKDADKISVETSKYFEIDITDEVKRIRSGVVVQRKQIVAVKNKGCVANQSETKTYRFRAQKSENWKNSAAG